MTSFGVQAKALFRKNILQQRRAIGTNIFIVLTPVFFCVLLYVLQLLIDNAIDTPSNKCGCLCLNCCATDANGTQTCRVTSPGNPCRDWEECTEYDSTQCGFEYSDAQQAGFCAVPSPSIWPAMVSVPAPGFLAHPWSPQGAVLMTGSDPTLVDRLSLFPNPNITAQDQAAAANFSARGQAEGEMVVYAGALSLLGLILGSFKKFDFYGYYFEPAFVPTESYNGSLSLMVRDAEDSAATSAAASVNTFFNSTPLGAVKVSVTPLGTDQVWLPSADDVNRALYCGYGQARCNGTGQINGIVAAYDFGATNLGEGQFATRMWYNSTDRYSGGGGSPPMILRIPGPLNAATQALLRQAINAGAGALARLVGVMEMPKPSTKLTLDIASLVGTLFYTWLLQLLLPMMLSNLVNEKEGRLRMMMKMHGLGDVAYWAIQYIWYFIMNYIYVWILIGVGTAINLSFFTLTDYSFQFVFYLLWVACLVSFTFLLATLFRSARTAVVVAFLYTFACGLLGYLLLQNFIAAGDWWVVFFDIIPGFALYRGLFEIAQYAFRAAYRGTKGMTWSSLSDPGNGLPAVMAFFGAEAIIFLILAWYLEKVMPGGVGVPRHPLFFLGKKFKSELSAGGGTGGTGNASLPVNGSGSGVSTKSVERPWWKFWSRKPAAAGKNGLDGPIDATDRGGSGGEAGMGTDASAVAVGVEPADVAAERERVDGIVDAAVTAGEIPSENVILIHNLRKVFPGRAKKVAVRDLTLAVSRGEVFGLLGPNGAGKSTALNILTGFLTPSGGTAVVQGNNIRTDMESVYGIMGVCPQDNLLWDRLTAREHLSFYGRLKGLVGKELASAVQSGLRAVNLWNGGVADKQVRAFSGGMKRRLSVAISLIGDPQVVYLDEPSTGLDPSSRQNLWSVVKSAKAGRGVILTTHSMEEASVLCDRLGIFVDGQLVCIGDPKELTARYGGYLVFTVTMAAGQEQNVDALVGRLSRKARLTYEVGTTRKYELPTSEVSLSSVFEEMERAIKSEEIKVLDWGVANATLEEVFIKFAKSIGAQGGG